MKKLIEGKIYNTETAIEICEYKAPCPVNDFHYFEESLFVTKRGCFFLCGEGGGLSRWSETTVDGHGHGYGFGIQVLSKDSALKWVENRDIDVESIQDHFDFIEA
ncbi:MAG: hypothetical protein DRN81_03045 [Thermoproteota archaeon]|nr:MAG: hypothetical protein DRN81_03045 [Candidatus Korarchaeota archaeon]